MAEPGGEIRNVRALPGVDPARVRALVDALAGVERCCGAVAERLQGATVHEHAFGKLIDAAKVRDAYHDRLPKAQENLAEAGTVAREFLTEFAEPAGSVPAVPPQREVRE